MSKTIEDVLNWLSPGSASPRKEEALNRIETVIKEATPEWAYKAYYTKHPVLWKPVAGAKGLDAAFNQGIEEHISAVLKKVRKS
jgi:hypothetical protein